MQIAFDVFDSNSDDKISEIDLFKLIYYFNQGLTSEEFNNIFNIDIC